MKRFFGIALVVAATAWGGEEALDRLLDPAMLPTAAVPIRPSEADVAGEPTRPTTVEVTVAPEALRERLREAVTDHYGLEGELVLMPAGDWPRLVLPSEDFGLELAASGPTTLSPLTTFRVTVSVGGSPMTTMALPCRLEHWVRAFVARGTVPRGTGLSPELFEISSVDALRQRFAPLPVEEPLLLYRCQSTLAAGKVLTWSVIERVPLVRKGQEVEVLATDGALRVTLKGTALQDGDQGDFVRVRNMESKREFHAQVIDANRLQVSF